MINASTGQQPNSEIETLKRSISRLHQQRNQLYDAHLAHIDKRISIAEDALYRLTAQPKPSCAVCGEDIATPYEGCCNEDCENYSHIPF